MLPNLANITKMTNLNQKNTEIKESECVLFYFTFKKSHL